MKISIENGQICNQTTMRERDWRDLVRLGLFMGRMALDWTL